MPSLSDLWPNLLYFCILPCGTIVAVTVLLILVVRLFRKIKIGPVELEDKDSKERPGPPTDKPSAVSGQPSAAGTSITISGSSSVGQFSTGDNSPNIKIDKVEQNIYPPPAEKPPAQAPTPSPRTGRFIDRGEIMPLLRKALRNHTTTAIVGVGGMGGVGKTELAKFLATEFNDVLWMSVGSRSLEHVQHSLAVALGIVLPPTLDAEGRATVLRAAFEQNPRTVIFDDVRLGFDLLKCLPPSPPCAVLITSRLRELPGVRRQDIQPLDVMTEKQALELLRAEGLQTALEDDEAAGKQLAKLCGHHPLALTLAAARWSQRPSLLAHFNQSLTHRLTQLSGLNPQDPTANLRANFDLSYEALPAEDQRRFRALGVFAETGFTPEAAQAVWSDPPAGADADMALRHLLTVSLLQTQAKGPTRDSARDTARGLSPLPAAERFALHDLLREYALEKLREAKEDTDAYRALAEWVKAFFENNNYDFANIRHDSLVAREADNLAIAINYANTIRDGERMAALVNAASNWMVYVIDPASSKRAIWLTAALSYGIEDRGLRANVLQAIGDVQQFRKENDAALKSYAEALTLFRQVGDKLGEANVLLSLGGAKRQAQDVDGARQEFSAALDLYRLIGDRYSIGRALYRLGDCAADQNEKDKALEAYQEAAGLWQSIGLADLVEQIIAPRIAACEANPSG